MNIRAKWLSIAAAMAASAIPFAAQTAGSTQAEEALARAYANEPTAHARAALIDYGSRHKDIGGALAFLAVGAADTRENRDQDALSHLKSARDRLPTLVDYIAFLTATSHFNLNDDEATIRALEAVWTHSPKSPLLAKSALLAAQAYSRKGDPRKALELLKKYYDDLPQPQGDLTLATCFEAAQDGVTAATYYQHVYFMYPNAAEASQAQTAMTRLQSSLGASYPPAMPNVMLMRALKLMDGGNYKQARTELEALIPLLGGADRDLARVRIGVADFKARDNAAAYQYLKSLQVTSPDADAERMFYLLSAARRLNNTDEVTQTLDAFARIYPQSKWRLQALVTAGNNFVIAHQPDAYEPQFEACYQSFPDSTEAAYCHWKVAFDEYMRRAPDAGQVLKTHLRTYPASDHAPAALYFLGRLAESGSSFADARAYYDEIDRNYPNYYYAVLARERLRDPNVVHVTASASTNDFLRSIQFPPRTRRVDFQPNAASVKRMERARLLAGAALDDLADSELRFAAKVEDQPQVMAVELARLATRRSAPDQAIRYIKRFAPGYLFIPMDSAPLEFWKLAFPMPYQDSLERYARERGLDPFIVAALILQESEFNAKAISRANAYGLTQILPSTGRELSRRLKIPRFNSRMLFQPDINLQLGTFYLRSLLGQLRDQWEPTLAAYNAGKTRAVAWLNWGDFREPAEFVEAVPFSETRNYIQIVIRNADIYRRLYGQKAAASDKPAQ